MFEFGENRVQAYPATAAVFIAKFCDFNLIQFTSYQLAHNSRGQASCRRYHVALAVDQILWQY